MQWPAPTTTDRLCAAAICLLVAVVLVGSLAPFEATTSEGQRQLEAAQNIREGRGLVISSRAAGADSSHVSLTVDPPLYPLALSLFVGRTDPARGAARLSVLALAVAAYLFFELAFPVIGYAGALLAALILSVGQPTLVVFSQAGSQALVLPLVLFAVWCCLRCVAAADGSPTRHKIALGVLTLSLVALAYTRYTALLFAVLLIYAWRLSGRTRLVWHAAAGAAVALPVGLLYLRNQLATGFLSGAERVGSTETLPGNLVDAVRTFHAQVAPGTGGLVAIALATVGVLVLKWRRPGASPSRTGPNYGHALTRVAGGAFVTYTLGLMLIATLKQLDLTDVRILAPAFTLLTLLLVAEAGRRWGEPLLPLRGSAILVGAVFLVGLIAAQGLEARSRAWVARNDATHADAAGQTDVSDQAERLAQAQLALAERMLQGGRFRDAAGILDRALTESTANRYRIAKGLATAYAGLYEVEKSYAQTAECLRLDRARAEMDITEIAVPYFVDSSAYRSGIDYYERLKQELPGTWWVYENIAVLARALGDHERAETHRKQSARLKAQGR
jgi:hypothetical protein